MRSEIRIYVACLAAYNDGILHGEWIDAVQGADDIQTAISDILSTSPIPRAEEWAIHDYEGFEGLHLSEYEGINSVVEKALFIEQRGELGAALVDYYGDIESAQSALEDHYAGVYESLEDFAQEITEDTTEIPHNLAHYIDYVRMGRDLAINDVNAITLNNGEVHIFWCH